MKVAVTGDRHWPGARYEDILRPLRRLDPKTDMVILGDATGVDNLARFACEELGLPFTVEEADWSAYGKAAGPHRNAAMLDHGPDEVWWWHSNLSQSKGTKNMLKQAKERNIPASRKGLE